jgi:hypothetical protein
LHAAERLAGGCIEGLTAEPNRDYDVRGRWRGSKSTLPPPERTLLFLSQNSFPCSLLRMAVDKINAQQGQKYEFKSGNEGKYAVLALGSGEVYYPSYVVCAVLFALSLQASKCSRFV